MPRNSKKGNFRLAGGCLLLFVGFSVAVFLFGQYLTVKEIDDDWVSTHALVLEKYLEEAPLNREFYITYEYDILGKSNGRVQYNNSVRVEEELYNKVSIGSSISIHYHPSNPKESVMDEDIYRVGSFQIYVALLFLVLGTGLFVWGSDALKSRIGKIFVID